MADRSGNTDRLIVLMTDFGLADPFVGTMKGVIYSINPEAKIIDLTHDIIPFNILQGALVLQSAYKYFPERTIFVAVVDPTVGSERKGLLVEAYGRFFVGPDNGMLWPAVEDSSNGVSIHIENARYFADKVSSTFHGRDVFAPVGAWLSRGVEPDEFGPRAESPVELDIPQAKMTEDYMISGEILFSDRFGNLATNIPGELLELAQNLSGNTDPYISVRKERIVGISTHYSDGTSQDKGLMALVNSWGYLEIYLPLNSAREQLGIEPGDPVWVSFS